MSWLDSIPEIKEIPSIQYKATQKAYDRAKGKIEYRVTEEFMNLEYEIRGNIITPTVLYSEIMPGSDEIAKKAIEDTATELKNHLGYNVKVEETVTGFSLTIHW